MDRSLSCLSVSGLGPFGLVEVLVRRHGRLWFLNGVVALSFWLALGARSFAQVPSGIKVVTVARDRTWTTAAKLAVQVERSLAARRLVVLDPSVTRFDPTDLDYLKFRKAGRIAVHRYKAGRYGRSVRALKVAIRLLERLMVRYGAVPLLAKKYVRAHYYLGAAYLKSADARLAAKAFREAAFFAPNGLPSSKRFESEVIDAYRRAKVLAGRRTGTVILRNRRPARMFLDGEAVGVAPTAIQDVPAGRHFLELYRPGFIAVRRFIDLDKTGFIWAPGVMPDPNQKALRSLLVRAERELRQKKKPGPAVAALASKLVGSQFVFCRASVDESEASWYLADARRFKKRVRRPNPVPGQAPASAILAALWRPKPVYELGQALAAACLTDDDCPGGKCIAGKCVRERPFYKRWWFWVAVGAGVAAAATAGALVATMPEKPIVRITTPP